MLSIIYKIFHYTIDSNNGYAYYNKIDFKNTMSFRHYTENIT